MANDVEARSTGNSALAIGLVAIALVALIAGFLFLRPGEPTSTTTIVENPVSPPNTTIVQPPDTTVVQPPSITINPSQSAPSGSSGSSGTSGSSSSGSSSSE